MQKYKICLVICTYIYLVVDVHFTFTIILASCNGGSKLMEDQSESVINEIFLYFS